jgi:hypothetical protein
MRPTSEGAFGCSFSPSPNAGPVPSFSPSAPRRVHRQTLEHQPLEPGEVFGKLEAERRASARVRDEEIAHSKRRGTIFNRFLPRLAGTRLGFDPGGGAAGRRMRRRDGIVSRDNSVSAVRGEKVPRRLGNRRAVARRQTRVGGGGGAAAVAAAVAQEPEEPASARVTVPLGVPVLRRLRAPRRPREPTRLRGGGGNGALGFARRGRKRKLGPVGPRRFNASRRFGEGNR